MAYMGSTAALDLDRFSNRQKTPELTALPENKNVKRRAPTKAPYGKYMMLFGLVFCALAVIVFSYMQMTQLTTENGRLKGEIEKQASEQKALEAKKEQMYNLADVEDYAKNVLGMVKLDKSTIQYVSLSREENTYIAQEEPNMPKLVSGLIRSFNAVLEYLN